MSQLKGVYATQIKQKTFNFCDECKKPFLSASKLRRHAFSHSDDKPFQCNLCEKLFKLESSLRRHRRHNHELTKKHRCTKCTASFAQRTNLHIHQERLHGRSTNFKCPQCDSFFKRLNVLNRHIKAQHADKPNLNSSYEDDPNSLAKLVVTQLKCLEQGISSLQAPDVTVIEASVSDDVDNDEKETETETTFVDHASFGEANLKIKLNPKSIVETIRVQTVKRLKERLAYICEYCAKEFYKSYNLIRHLRTHTKERPYSCLACSSKFTIKTHLEAHFKRMHVLDEITGHLANQHKCFICTLNFSSMRKLDSHMKSHEALHRIQYLCSICNRKFSSKTAFSSHAHKTEDKELAALEELLAAPRFIKVAEKALKIKQLDKVFTCSICNLPQRTQQDLYKHKKQHDVNKKYKCWTCGNSYLSNISLRSHQKLHHKRTNFACPICFDRKSPTKFQFQRHQRHVHQEERNFQCTYCVRKFKSAAHCKSHMKSHLKQLLGPPSQEENTCEQPISTRAQLVIQEKNGISSTPKFIQIEMLPKLPKCKNRNINVEQIAIETLALEKQTVKQHNCTHCGKVFQKPSDLTRHLRHHTQERPFTCDVCKKSFKLKSTLDDHCKTHLTTAERFKINVACQVCGKAYANQKSLTVHLRLHTGYLPFECESCGKFFRTSGHRLAHLKAARNGNCKNFKNTLQK